MSEVPESAKLAVQKRSARPLSQVYQSSDFKQLMKSKDLNESTGGGVEVQERIRSPSVKSRKKRKVRATSVRISKGIGDTIDKQAAPRIYVPRKTFGVSLKAQMKSQSFKRESLVRFDTPLLNSIPQVPTLIYKTVQYLKEKGALETEGIFRMCGKHDTLTKGRELVDNEEASIDEVLRTFDLHTAGDFLKLYLRSLPESIVPLSSFVHFANAEQLRLSPRDVKKYKTTMNAIYLDYIGATLNSLPKVNSNLLLYLLDFLKEITLHKSVTRMDARNISSIFGTIIFGMPEQNGTESFMKEIEQRSVILEFLIQYLDEIRTSRNILMAMSVTKSWKSKKKRQKSLIKGEIIFVFKVYEGFLYCWVGNRLEIYSSSMLSSLRKIESEVETKTEPHHLPKDRDEDSAFTTLSRSALQLTPGRNNNVRRSSMTPFMAT